MGGDAGLSVGYLEDRDVSTFEEYANKHSSVSFSAGIVDYETGYNQVGGDIGFGYGASIDKMNLKVTSSLSVTKQEWRSIGGLSKWISVGNIRIESDNNGNVVARGEVITRNIWGRKNNTGITALSGVKYVNGAAVSNDLWQSEAYR